MSPEDAKLELFKALESKKAVVVLLRWLLIIATSYLILFSGNIEKADTRAHGIVLLLVATNLLVSAFPKDFFSRPYFDHCLVVADIVLISAAIGMTGQMSGDFYLLYFLIIMISAVSHSTRAIFLSATLVAAVYLLMIGLYSGYHALLKTEVLIRVPFFFVVAIFYGYLTQLVRNERQEKVAYREKFGLATKMRELSTQLSASLDRDEILQTLVRSIRDYCESDFAAVVSRGAQSVLAIDGETELFKGTQRRERFFENLDASYVEVVSQQDTSAMPVVDRGILENPPPAASVPHLTVSECMLLPLGRQLDSDLYLCLSADLDREMLEYARVLLLSTSMALHNAGQYQALVHEVEKRQQVAKQLTKALEFKSEFLANISHELRTPLYSLIGYAELVTDGGYGEVNEEQSSVMNRIIGNANETLELINNILDLSKLEAGELKPNYQAGSLKEFVDEIVETCSPLLQDKPVALRLDVRSTLPSVVTDWGMLRHIAMNLFSNAVKFTKQGEVLLAAKVDKKLRQIVLQVRDTGIGIDPERIEEIFQAFRQLDNSYVKKYAGTGLGLSITKKQVELLGGSIRVKSEPGVGSIFTVFVPLQRAADETCSTSIENPISPS